MAVAIVVALTVLQPESRAAKEAAEAQEEAPAAGPAYSEA